MPIQLVASACSRCPPLGQRLASGRRRRCCRGPRKPPSKTLLPCASLRFTHQVKFSISLWKTRSRKARSATPFVAALDLVDAPARPTRAPAGSRRRTPTRRRGAARSGACTTRAARSVSCSLAKSGSTSANGTQWKARSQAAYQGYSHLSGHRDDVAVVEVRPLVVPAVLARLGGGGARRVAVEPVVDDVVVELLRPEQPGERLALHGALRRRRASGGSDGGVELVGLGAAAAKTSSKSTRTGAAGCDGSARRSATHVGLARREDERVAQRRPWCRSARGFTAPPSPWTT